MKRLLVSTALIGLIVCSKPALAADEIGIYVAPKLFWEQQVFSSDSMDSNVMGSNLSAPSSVSDVSKSKDKSVLGGALALGYDFSPHFALPIRTEIEFALHGQSKYSDSGTQVVYGISHTRKTDISTLFANVFYDINTGTNFTPYFGGGVGTAFIHAKDNFTTTAYGPSSSSKDVSNFAWNLGAGVAYSFDSNWKLDLGYRYSDFGKVKGSVAKDGNDYLYEATSHITSHEVGLGLRYEF